MILENHQVHKWIDPNESVDPNLQFIQQSSLLLNYFHHYQSEAKLYQVLQ